MSPSPDSEEALFNAAAQLTSPAARDAFKVIKLGMDTRDVIARFEAERQALALMDHPSIAKVLDAGTIDTVRPFFVMELVRGIRRVKKIEPTKIQRFAGRSADCSQAVGSVKSRG